MIINAHHVIPPMKIAINASKIRNQLAMKSLRYAQAAKMDIILLMGNVRLAIKHAKHAKDHQNMIAHRVLMVSFLMGKDCAQAAAHHARLAMNRHHIVHLAIQEVIIKMDNVYHAVLNALNVKIHQIIASNARVINFYIMESAIVHAMILGLAMEPLLNMNAISAILTTASNTMKYANAKNALKDFTSILMMSLELKYADHAHSQTANHAQEVKIIVALLVLMAIT